MRYFHHPEYGIVAFGQDPPPPAPTGENFSFADFGAAVRKITPAMVVVGVATGAAFAIGSGLVARFLFRPR